MKTVALVSCVKTKRKKECEAQNLYISSLFKGMRAYAEEHADAWYILSAKYGLLSPYDVIPSYEKTLITMSQTARKNWAAGVWNTLSDELEQFGSPNRVTIMFLAGKMYREHLMPLLKEEGYHISIPMKDMKMGDQLKWLKAQTKPTRSGFGIVG